MSRIGKLLNENEIVFSMSCYDALSARIVERAGFPICSISGLASEASERGVPDLGMGSSAEFARRAANVRASINIPLICDVDTGFGGPLNVVRTTQSMEAAGVDAIHIEDQRFPKRCGVLAGKSVIDLAAAARRVRAAADARSGKDMLIIARTDAGGLGVDEVVRRLNAYADNGAEMGMLGDYYSADDYRRITSGVHIPVLTCAVDASNAHKQPYLTADEWKRTGIRVVMYWHVALFAAIRAVGAVAAQLKAETSNANAEASIANYAEYANLVGLNDWMSVDQDYGGDEEIISVPGGTTYKVNQEENDGL
jgi:2-methylisocitrate lyase-like PEP mutase family enzyme